MSGIDDVVNSLPNIDNNNGYQPVQSPVTGSAINQVNSQSQYANRPVQSFQNEANQGVSEQSNLMGPSNPNDPQSQALQARAQSAYKNNLNQIMMSGDMQGYKRQLGLQAQDVSNRANAYTTAQTVANTNFQQISFQRETAIAQEQINRQMLMSIFQGVGTVGAYFGMKGLMNARRPSPSESRSPSGSGIGYGDIQANADDFQNQMSQEDQDWNSIEDWG